MFFFFCFLLFFLICDSVLVFILLKLICRGILLSSWDYNNPLLRDQVSMVATCSVGGSIRVNCWHSFDTIHSSLPRAVFNVDLMSLKTNDVLIIHGFFLSLNGCCCFFSQLLLELKIGFYFNTTCRLRHSN